MAVAKTSTNRFYWIAATLVAPFALQSILVLVCEPMNLPEGCGSVLLVLAVLAGCVLCWNAAYGLHWAVRATFIAVLAPILAWMLFFWLLTFSGLVYGTWL